MAKREKYNILELASKLLAAGDDEAAKAAVEEEIHRLHEDQAGGRPSDYYLDVLDIFFDAGYILETGEKGNRTLGKLLAWDRVGPKWLEDMDSAHLALWAARDLLGFSAKHLAFTLNVSKGRISQFMKPSEPIPKVHRLRLLGILDRAIDEWSSEVRVQYSRQKLVRATRTNVVELLTTIRDAEQEALFPSTVGA